MFARVVSISHLPIPPRMASLTCLTAVRMLTIDGETAGFFADNPLAATLMAGDWVEYDCLTKDCGDNLRLSPEPKLGLSLATAPDEVLNMLHLMAHMTDTGRGHAGLARYKTVYEQLAYVRQGFRLKQNDGPLPDVLVIERLPQELKEFAQKYVDVVS